ncbi:hypothetical protein ACHAXS_009343 [Conticribra weissflogii]
MATMVTPLFRPAAIAAFLSTLLCGTRLMAHAYSIDPSSNSYPAAPNSPQRTINNNCHPQNEPLPTRRRVLSSLLSSSAAIPLIPTVFSSPSNALTTATASNLTTGLAAKLSARDPSLLKNRLFNIPPSPQIYPPFLRGTWDVSLQFSGFLFPSTSLSKQTLLADTSIPGFQKCSIAAIADVGKESITTYRMAIDETTGLEDRKVALKESPNAFLGYDAVREVIYDGNVGGNPNRIGIDFVPNRTRNANRIELFCNGRESEWVTYESQQAQLKLLSQSQGQQQTKQQILQPGEQVFLHSEYIRQVTFSLSQEFGVARQVSGNYAHFWTWKGNESDPERIEGNLLTAAYLDAQDPLFFEEPSKPVVVYAHNLIGRRAVV